MGMSNRAAPAAYFPLLRGGDATLGAAPPPWRWSRRALATDLFGKGVLAFATSGAHGALKRAA
jgi:hypothetical protein